ALDPNRDVPPPASGDGAIVWHELATSDPEGALAFYGALFGWSKGRTMAPSSDAGHAYHLIADQGKDVAGLMELPDPSIPRPYWLQYVQVADVAGTARRAVAMGGQTLHGPVDLADGHGRIAVVQDPTGAWIGIWQSASKG
ncbi:MAG: VOC family protein, partial [Myxococcales bacterium]|nr:VOC family protein [Myxococcales bacterium]